ncbi:MAG TPA: hypothetical protein PLH27_04725 [bacterium]|nr:hypothetical protein [bacterium]HNB08639.1 hypothetical protein [bacterium]HNC48268.1 hypothetical protein [bacterium]HND78287.1 hypothetical protein [bacterium]HNE84512.1 hypothetical protein [bacterium]
MPKTFYTYTLMWVSLVSGFTFFSACEKPVEPQFTSALRFPLSKDIYDIFDLKKDIENGKDSLAVDIISDSVVIRIFDRETIHAGDELNVDPTSDSADAAINNDLKVRDSVDINLRLGDLAPGFWSGLHGTNAVIPAFNMPGSYTPTSRNTTQFTQFKSATLYSGNVALRFTNNTSCAMDSLNVVIFNSTSRTRIDSFVIKNIPATLGSVSQKSITYPAPSSKVVRDSVTIRIAGYSSGSGSSELVDSTAALAIHIVSDITASSVTGKFPSQTISNTDSIVSDSQSDIDSAYIERGSIRLNIRPLGLSVNASVTFTMYDFVDNNGVPLTRSFNIIAGQNSTQILDLKNYRLIPNWSVSSSRFVDYRYTIVTVASTNNNTVISNGNGVRVVAVVDSLHFSRMRGTLSNEDFTISNRSQDVNIRDLDSIQLRSAFFEIITSHRIPFPVAMSMTLTGKRGTRSASTVINGSLNKYTSGTDPQRDTLRTPLAEYDEVAALLNLVPDSIYVSGGAIVGDNVANGVITKQDSIDVRINLRAPLVFKLPNDSTKNRIRPTPHVFDVGEGTRKRIYSNLESVRITGTIKNHFPVPVSVQFIIDSTADAARFYDSTNAYKLVYPSSPLIIGAGQVNSSTGLVTAPTTTTLDYALNKTEFQRLFAPEITKRFRGIKAKLMQTPGTDFVKVSSADYVDLDTEIEIEVQIDENLQ